MMFRHIDWPMTPVPMNPTRVFPGCASGNGMMNSPKRAELLGYGTGTCSARTAGVRFDYAATDRAAPSGPDCARSWPDGLRCPAVGRAAARQLFSRHSGVLRSVGQPGL